MILPSLRRSGNPAEQLFRELTGAEAAHTAALGDAILEGHYIEVKKAGSPTLNQIRAVKYLPLVVYRDPPGEWYVIPANVIVQSVALKKRGQHTEIPFESAVLTLTAMEAYLVPAEGLRQAVLDAVAEGARYPELRAEMQRVLQAAQQLAQESTQRVKQVLDHPSG